MASLEKKTSYQFFFIFVYVKTEHGVSSTFFSAFSADYAYQNCIFCILLDFPFGDKETREKNLEWVAVQGVAGDYF